jgi:molybdopterin synthase catalytic subunit
MLLRPGPLDHGALLAAVADPDHGGTATFVGTIRRDGGGREVVELRYEAYDELALAEMASIAAEAEARFRVRVAIAHELKSRAPIWKQTVYTDGATHWVDGCAAPDPASVGR